MKRYMGLWLAALLTLLIMAACNTVNEATVPAGELALADHVEPILVGDHCPGGNQQYPLPPEYSPAVKVEANGGNQDDINAYVPPAGTVLCIKSGGQDDKATGIFTVPAGSTLTLQQWLEHFGIVGGDGQGRDVSYYMTYGEPIEPQADITVTKTAETYFEREHFWDIDKRVETDNGLEHEDLPKIWLYTDGSGDETATWIIDVAYVGAEDSAFKVYGEIRVEADPDNDLDAVIDSIDDYLTIGEDEIEVEIDPADCKLNDVAITDFPITLEAGDVLVCSYEAELEGATDGRNDAVVYGSFVNPDGDDIMFAEPAFDDFEFDLDDPNKETNATVNVKDISDLFDEVDLGTVTAPNDATFDYTKDFAYADFEECGDFSYYNEATILETDQSADATLLVNVQCLVFKGETAWAANGNMPLEFRYTNRGNWATYVQYTGEKTTTLFAGQTIDVGTVHFSAAVGGEVVITVSLTGDWEFEDVAENLMVQDYAVAPSGNPSPGLFDHKKYCEPEDAVCTITVPQNNFYGVHVNVGQWVPDPDFGP